MLKEFERVSWQQIEKMLKEASELRLRQ